MTQFFPTRRSYLKLSAALAATATLGLSACSADTGTGTAQDPTILRFTWWGGDARHKLTEEIIANFNAAHPTIRVQGEYSDWAGYWDRLATQVAGNDAPDIIQMDEKYVREYGDRGALLDLHKLGGVTLTDYAPDTLRSGEVNGQLHGLVTGISTLAIAANPAVLAAAGVALPDDSSWTWEEYLALGREVSAKLPGTIGVGLGFGDTDIYLWARQRGDRLYDDAAQVVIKPETLSSFWEFYLQASKSGAAAAPSAIIENAGLPLDQSPLATGTMAFAGIFNSQLRAYTAASGQDLVLLRIPGEAAARERAAYYKSSMFWSVSARTKNQEAAGTFLNYLSSSQEAGDLLLAERGIPANDTIRAAIADKLSPGDVAATAFSDAIAEEVRPAPPITPVGGSIVDSILARFTSDVLFERLTPTAAAEAFIAELSSAIGK